MRNLIYLRNTRKFKKIHLPMLIKTYDMNAYPFDQIGIRYVGTGIHIIVDKRDVRISVYDPQITSNLERIGLKR